MSMDPVPNGAVVGGSGTVGRIPVWAGTSTLGNSHLADTVVGSFVISFAGTITANRSWSFQDRDDTFAGLGATQIFTGMNSFNLGGSISGFPTVTDAVVAMYGLGGALSTRLALFCANSGAGGAPITIWKARGDGTTPTAAQSGDQLVNIGGRPRGATIWATGNRAEFQFVMAQTATDTANGTAWLLNLTANGTTSLATKVSVCDDASVQIGGTPGTVGWGGGLALGFTGSAGQGILQLVDGGNIGVGTGTGTKIGTATTQKLGFFNATPVVQQNTTGTATGFTANVGTAVNDTSTFTGGVGATAYRVSDVVRALKQLGLLAQ